jgi:hypothetical protein
MFDHTAIDYGSSYPTSPVTELDRRSIMGQGAFGDRNKIQGEVCLNRLFYLLVDIIEAVSSQGQSSFSFVLCDFICC